jgi:hypothetical protein
LLAPALGLPRFDSDYLALQPRGSESARLEREMVSRSDLSPQFAAFVAPSRDEALALTERLLASDAVGEVHSIAELESFDLPDSFVAGFRSDAGRYAVYAYPADNVWESGAQSEFLDAAQAIDPEVTGMPVLGQYMFERAKRALSITAAIVAVIVLVSVWIDFRELRLTVIAVAPTFLTVTGLLGAMGACGIAFNPINVMALPIVMGIAVDDDVHMVHRYLAERGDVARTLRGTGRSVVLTSATTIAAFGTLAFSAHRGLASFGSLVAIGSFVALVLSVFVLPVLLQAFAPQDVPLRAGPGALAAPDPS